MPGLTHGLWSVAQPWVSGSATVLFPALTLWYAQRNHKTDTTRSAGQQLIDNLYKEIAKLTAAVESACDAKAEAESLVDSERERYRKLLELHDHLLAEWVEIGTTRAEQLALARFGYSQRMAHEGKDSGKDS